MAKYLVRLTAEERTPLTALISTGRRAASVVTRARMLRNSRGARGGPARERPGACRGRGDPSRAPPSRAAGLRRGRLGRRPGTAAAHGPAGAHVGRRAGGPAGRLDVPRAPGGACPLAAPVAGRPARCPGSRGDDGPGVGADPAKHNARTPWQKTPGGMPPHAHAACVWAMADVLDVSTRSDDPQRPVGCLEEARQQLVAATRGPRPATPGKRARLD